MPSNPLTPQGNLNRIRASLLVPAFPQLNITVSFMGRRMLSLSYEGSATLVLPSSTGTINSPEPYQMVRCSVDLLRTQGLAAAWENQRLTNSVIDSFTVIPDSTMLPSIYVHNGSIENLAGSLQIDGTTPDYPLVLTGYVPINNDLWAV